MTFEGISMPRAEETDDNDALPVDVQIDLLSIPQQTLAVPKNFDIMTALPLDCLAKLPNPAKGHPGWLHHSLIWQVMCWAKQSGISYHQFWQWNKQKNNTAERFKRWEKQWKRCTYNISPKVIDAMLLRTYPKILETQVTKVFREQFDIPDVKIVEDDYMQEGHISRD
ncbi:hypothetical protein HDU89_006957, partial [Geranomyces variabilis]